MKVTPEISEFLRANMKLKKEAEAASIDLDHICSLVATFNSKNPKLASVDLAKLLESSSISHRVRRPTQQAPATEIESIRKRAQERQYQKSVAGVVPTREEGAASDFKSMGDSISFASHFILAFVSSFLAGYYLAEYVMGITEPTIRYIIGGAASFLVLIVESVLFILQENRRTSKKKTTRIIS